MDLATFRSQHPVYDDMSDEQLGKALYGKYYSDMPYETFWEKVKGKSTELAQVERKEGEPTVMPLEPAKVGLRPAIMYKGQKYEGVEGNTHPDIMKEANIGSDSKHQKGFVTPSGSFMTREQAKRWMKKNRPNEYEAWVEEVEGETSTSLHSQDLNKAKRNT